MKIRFAVAPILFAIVATLVGCAGSPPKLAASNVRAGTGFVRTVYKAPNGESRNLTVFVPMNYDSSRAWPAVVFMHGLFEGGNDGNKNTTVGIGPAIAKNPSRFNCFVIFPQSPSGSWGDESQYSLAVAALDHVSSLYTIDPQRVSITGLSTGGLGTWRAAANYPDRFVRVAPMCAYDDYDNVPKLTKRPVWAFHNAGDPFVGAGGTKKMVERINAAGGNAKATIYGGIGHNCWDRAYADADFIAWLTFAK